MMFLPLHAGKGKDIPTVARVFERLINERFHSYLIIAIVYMHVTVQI